MVADNYIMYQAFADYAWAPEYYDKQTAPSKSPPCRSVSSPTLKFFTPLWKPGEVTIAALPPAHLEQAKSNPDITVVEGLEVTLRYLGINNQDPLLSDFNVREAIAYAIDRDELNEVAYEGTGCGDLRPVDPGSNWI